MKTASGRVVTAIFCDDMRQEVGNKMSFMGCYQGELLVPISPIALPKLCVFLSLLTPVSRPVRSLRFRLVLDDTELSRVDVPKEAWADAHQISEAGATRIAISGAMIFSPFLIQKSGVLKVSADTDEGEIIGPRLLIKVESPKDVPTQPVTNKKGAKPATKKVGARKKVTEPEDILGKSSKGAPITQMNSMTAERGAKTN